MEAQEIDPKAQQGFAESIMTLARDCKFNDKLETFEGYDSNGNITSECLTAIDNYARWFAEVAK